jgi:hypothetical protein
MIKLVELPPEEAEIFWGEIAPSEHLVQIYPDDALFLDALEGFVAGGLREGETVVVIATAPHLAALEERLRAAGFSLEAARLLDRYFPLEATTTLSKLVNDGKLDVDRITELMMKLINNARGNGRRVRLFGEMVALLWAQGHHAATVQLELLWHQFCQDEGFSLLCAYPKNGFAQNAGASIRQICSMHSKVIELLPRLSRN